MSQPTLSRGLRTLGESVVPFGAARSIQYALRDDARAELLASVFQVSADGRLSELGTLVPVCPEGFVVVQSDGVRRHAEGLPWWLHDMRPQGYLGRSYNLQHGGRLGLPPRLSDWNDGHVLKALLLQGEDLPGNLLVGTAARERFVNAPLPEPIAIVDKSSAYAALAAAAARGEHPGSSAGGEQPKFTAYAELADGPAHVIVKFTALADSPVSQRWRDILLAEHVALEVLRDHGLPAARSALHHAGSQRFLEIRRFDREGRAGRRASFSIAALDAEFVGSGAAWPRVARALAAQGIVQEQAVATVDLLWAFGTLVGNTDMHGGNLAFMGEPSWPYVLAPAYDMTPMAFAPTTGGDLPERELILHVGSEVPAPVWHRALPMAQAFVLRLEAGADMSAGFAPCLAFLHAHLAAAAERIARLD